LSFTSELKAVSDYANIPLSEVMNLPYSEYRLYLKESWIFTLKQSEAGRKFLETCWRLKQTAADEKAIKEYQNRGEF
jgi:hypothetical protein